MINLMELFNKKAHSISKEDLATLLRTNVAALDAFEKSYKDNVLDIEEPTDFYDVNSRQMAKKKEELTENTVEVEDIIQRIVQEFLAETPRFQYDRHTHQVSYIENLCKLEDNFAFVSKQEINRLAENLRPQCTSKLQKRDIGAFTYIELLTLWKKYQDSHDIQAYHMFRQSLDILDLDPITYEILGMNKVSIGYWFPKLVTAVEQEGYFLIPSTTIIKVPMNMLQLTRVDYESLTRTTLDIVDRFCFEAFGLDENFDYFIKTGTYSSKFDFRNCRVVTPKEVRELGEYLLFIHYQVLQKAEYFNIGKDGKPISMYGAGTTNEWCVREYIKDVEGNPCIYKGLPLHTEYRVFVDFDKDTILSCNPYWHPDVMKQRFAEGCDINVHDFHDYEVYKAHEDVLMNRYNANKSEVLKHLDRLIAQIDLEGQWSIDIMQNGKDFWIIDMATAETSAFYNSVPLELRNPMVETWIPDMSKKVK